MVKDFNVKSLHQKIEPMILYVHPQRMAYFLVRITPDDAKNTINILKTKWQEFDPTRPFQYSFIDETFEQFYISERNLGKIFTYFTILAVFTACIGLFGLASFTAEQRTKEIGIRKVLGASVSKLIQMLSKEFIILVALSNIIAWPISYYIMNKMLQNYAYRIGLSVFDFLVSGILAVLIAFFTVSYQAYKTANANPVDTLRYE